MAGTFAHMTLVDSLCQADVLDKIDSLTNNMKRALMQKLKYCELGAVSPDYPSLTLLSDNATGWANVMHYWKTADIIRFAIPYILSPDNHLKDTQQCIAWLFGYAAHLVTDLTIHPIVNLRVGEYEKNKTEHRVCEMNQDVYIFNKILHQEITEAEYFKRDGISSCSDPTNKHNLNPDICNLWCHYLNNIKISDIRMKPGLATPNTPPEPNVWHRYFITLIDNFAEEGGYLPPLSRHFAEGTGLVYPTLNDLDISYIENLLTPEKKTEHYDSIFKRTQENVKNVWREIGIALYLGKQELFTLRNGNLDTGLDESNNMIFWEVKE